MRLSIGRKLQAGFASVLVFMAALGVFSLLKLADLQDKLERMYTNQTMVISLIKEANLNMMYRNWTEKNMILASDPSEIAAREAEIQGFEQTMTELMEMVKPLLQTEADRAEYRVYETAWKELDVIHAQILGHARRNEDAQAVAAEARAIDPLTRVTNAIIAISKSAEYQAAMARDESRMAYQQTMWLSIALLIGALALGTGISLYLSRQIARGIKEVADAAGALAQGRLDHRIEVHSNDELGDMARSFQSMTASLRGIIGQVRSVSGAVADSAGQISSSSEEMAHSAQSQAAAVEETSSAMEEMAASITQVSGNAQTLAAAVEETSGTIEEMVASIQTVSGNAETLGVAVNQTSASIEEMVASIREVARNAEISSQNAVNGQAACERGTHAVESTISGMQRINSVMGEVVAVIEGLGKSSEEIGAIIAVIDDIAEQTNLLALNAAIEAARAGEHGRGFAVVADEVRKLAERSAKATGEIATLIKGIQQETEKAIRSTEQGEAAIDEGTKLAHEAGDAIQAIVHEASQSAAVGAEIAQATREQTLAVNQILEAVESMNRLTQQVMVATREQATGSEQIIMAVESMNRMTQQVSVATSEQRKGGEQVVQAVSNINRSAQETANATSFVAQAASDLQDQAKALAEAIAFFQGVTADESRALGGKVPQAPALMASGR